MIGVFVTFRHGDKFNEQAVRKIAQTARVRFEGMPGYAQRPSRSIPESARPQTSTFGTQRTQPKRSSLISYSSGWPASTECAPAWSSCRLPHSWRTPGRDVGHG